MKIKRKKVSLHTLYSVCNVRFAWFHYTLIRYLLYDANHPTGIFEYIWLYTFFFSLTQNTLLCVFNRFFLCFSLNQELYDVTTAESFVSTGEDKTTL